MRLFIAVIAFAILIAGSAVLAQESEAIGGALKQRIHELEQAIRKLEAILEGTERPANLARTSLASVSASSVNGGRALDNVFYGILNAFDEGEKAVPEAGGPAQDTPVTRDRCPRPGPPVAGWVAPQNKLSWWRASSGKPFAYTHSPFSALVAWSEWVNAALGMTGLPGRGRGASDVYSTRATAPSWETPDERQPPSSALPVDTTLDVGSGTGLGTSYAATIAARVVAIDPSKEMTARLYGKIRIHDLENVEVRQGHFPDALLPGESFDSVISSFMLAHLECGAGRAQFVIGLAIQKKKGVATELHQRPTVGVGRFEQAIESVSYHRGHLLRAFRTNTIEALR